MSIVPNADAIRATYRWLAHAEHGVTEVRIIRPNGAGVVGIGFFDHEDAMVEACVAHNESANVYAGIQPRPRALLARAPNEIRRIKAGAKASDIEVVTAAVHDIDPVREKDTASTAAELELAFDAARCAIAAWNDAGLAAPARMMSGNGTQLWGSCSPIVLTAENRGIVQANLKSLEAAVRAKAASPQINVDSIHDLARIIKVIGTVSRKGDHSAVRPHRVSYAIDPMERVPDPMLAPFLLGPPAEPERKATRAKLVVVPEQVEPRNEAKPCVGGGPSALPCDMCSPMRQLWDEGFRRDRSLGIFNLVMWLMHKGMPAQEIVSHVVAYDKRCGGKLDGRNAEDYVKRYCIDKIETGRRIDGTVLPPCHSMQSNLEFCAVNRDPNAKCDLYATTFDLAKAIEAIPKDLTPEALSQQIAPILETIAARDVAVRSRYIDMLVDRFGLKARDLRARMKMVEEQRTAAKATGSPPPDEARSHTAASGPDATSPNAIVGEIQQDVDFYFRMGELGTEIISSFVIVPKARLSTEEGEMILGEARTDGGEVVPDLILPLKAFYSKKDLIRHLPSADLQWTGDDANTQGLLRMLARRQVPRRAGTKMLGYYERDGRAIWICERGAFTSTGFVESSPITYLASDGALNGKVHYPIVDDQTFARIASTIFEHLPRANTPEVTVPIVGWFFATPSKERFMRTARSFPILHVHGPAGSGKSSLLCDVMWPMFGITDGEAFSATDTDFAMIRSLTSTRSIPIVIDEYKPFDMPRDRRNTLHRLMRRAYRGEADRRGRADQGLNKYPLRAPLCVAGEALPTETAILERLIAVAPKKATLTESESYAAAFNQLKAVDLAAFAGRYIQFDLASDFDEEYERARIAIDAVIGSRVVPMRIRQNLVAMAFGVQMFTVFATQCGHTVPLDLRLGVDAVLDDLLEGGNGTVKSPLDQFIQMLGVMATQRELKHGQHYVWKDGLLWIHLETCYDQFRQHCKRIDHDGEIVGEQALRALIRENIEQRGYVKDQDRVYFTSTDRRRAIALDLSSTPFVAAESFPHESAESAVENGAPMTMAEFQRVVRQFWNCGTS